MSVKLGLRVKICGITNAEQGEAIAQMGATTLGFICAPESPRFILPEQIRAIVDELPIDPKTGRVGCDRVGVFVNASVETITQTVSIGNLNGVQLHGSESPELCHQLRIVLPNIELIKALRVRSLEALDQTMQYESAVDTLLLDAYHPDLPGGTGKTLNWQALKNFRPFCPWFLAGGLTPGNILAALNQVSPEGIDLSSGVEHSPGNKDLEKVSQLFAQLKQIAKSYSR